MVFFKLYLFDFNCSSFIVEEKDQQYQLNINLRLPLSNSKNDVSMAKCLHEQSILLSCLNCKDLVMMREHMMVRYDGMVWYGGRQDKIRSPAACDISALHSTVRHDRTQHDMRMMNVCQFGCPRPSSHLHLPSLPLPQHSLASSPSYALHLLSLSHPPFHVFLLSYFLLSSFFLFYPPVKHFHSHTSFDSTVRTIQLLSQKLFFYIHPLKNTKKQRKKYFVSAEIHERKILCQSQVKLVYLNTLFFT